MDIFNTEYTQATGAANGVMEDNLRKDREVAQIQRDNFRKAFKAGVKMAFGTDAGVMPHETAAGQFRIMVEYGMSPLDAIRAATANAADALGQTGEVGTLKPGAWADMVVVNGDPLADVTILEKGGRTGRLGPDRAEVLTRLPRPASPSRRTWPPVRISSHGSLPDMGS